MNLSKKMTKQKVVPGLRMGICDSEEYSPIFSAIVGLLFNEQEEWKQYGLTYFNSVRPLVVQENQVALETSEPSDTHLDQPSIRDLKATIKFLEEGIGEYKTPAHKDLEARINLDADTGEATVTDSERQAFDEMFEDIKIVTGAIDMSDIVMCLSTKIPRGCVFLLVHRCASDI